MNSCLYNTEHAVRRMHPFEIFWYWWKNWYIKEKGAQNKNAPFKRISTHCEFILCTSSLAFSKVQKEKKSGYVPFFNPLSLSDTDTIPTYKRVPKVVKFTMRTNLPKLYDLLIFCIYSLNFRLEFFHHDFFWTKLAKY